mgnify:CR=1 FL=1
MSEPSFFKRLKRRLNWTDIGFSAADEERFNDEGVFTPREIVLTINIDPATGDMVAPGAGAIDPTISIGDVVDIAFTLAKKTTPIFKSLIAIITTTNTIMTLEDPGGTDYQVPSGKVFYFLKVIFSSGASAINFGLGYGDTGVANGITEPTAPVFLMGNTSAQSPLSIDVANKPYEIPVYASVPAGKFPFANTVATSATKMLHAIGVEVDA